jgi:hypothetical protein
VKPQGIGGSVNAHCGFLINCTYDGEGLEGHGLGPLLSGTETNGQVRIEEAVTHRVSGVCPETAKLDLLTTPLEATSITFGMNCVEINTGESAKFLSKNGTKCENEDATTQEKDPNVPARAHIYRLVG